ncbi:MAG: flippase-like domain-containing protein [Ignavibacteriales bacterium]|nr:flippase-like domain-containing protein [Ignavibacteriales bacterium]
MKKILINILKIIITFAILYFMIQSGRLDFTRLDFFLRTPGLFLLLFIVFIFWSLPLISLRWWLLLRTVQINFSYSKAFKLTWIGYFFSLGLPGSISGDVVKGYYVFKDDKSNSKTNILMALLIDRFIGMSSLIFISFIILVFNLGFFSQQPETKTFAWIISGLFFGTALLYLLVFMKFNNGKDPFLKIISKLPASEFFIKLYYALKIYRDEKQILFRALFLSLLDQAGNLFVFYQITSLFGVADISLANLFMVIPLGLITTVIPLAPVGIGVGHAAFDSLYSMIGYSNGADVFNLFVTLEIIVFAVGGILFLLEGERSKAKIKIENSDI